MAKEHAILFKSPTNEQVHINEDIITTILSQKRGFFLHGYGGTWKFFM